MKLECKNCVCYWDGMCQYEGVSWDAPCEREETDVVSVSTETEGYENPIFVVVSSFSYVGEMKPWDIIDRIDISDCSGEELEVYMVEFGKPMEKLVVRGCWHDFDDPLHIVVERESGEWMFDGYGTDH